MPLGGPGGESGVPLSGVEERFPLRHFPSLPPNLGVLSAADRSSSRGDV